MQLNKYYYSTFENFCQINLYLILNKDLKLEFFKNFFKMVDISKKIVYNKQVIRGVAQFGSALGLGPRCRRFESCRPDHVIKTACKKAVFCLLTRFLHDFFNKFNFIFTYPLILHSIVMYLKSLSSRLRPDSSPLRIPLSTAHLTAPRAHSGILSSM